MHISTEAESKKGSISTISLRTLYYLSAVIRLSRTLIIRGIKMNLKLVRHLPEAEVQGTHWEISIMSLQSHADTFFAFPLSTKGLIIKVKGEVEEDKTIIQSLPDTHDFEMIIPLPMISYSKYKLRILSFIGLDALDKEWDISIRDYRLQREFPIQDDHKVLLKPTTIYSLEQTEDMLWVKKNKPSGKTGLELVIKKGER